MKKHTPKLLWAILIIFVSGAILRFYWEPEFAYIPPRDQVLNPAFRGEKPAYDVWGRSISAEEAAKLKKTDKGRKKLSPEQGAVPINPDTLNLGRKTFYQETFGNEVFLTDILGLVDGAVTIPNIMKAIWKLKGRGTTNLRVELAKTVTVGGKTFKKGTLIDTGIDVPKGAYMPLGMPVKFSGGRLKVGISCAACHATVDRESKKVVEGASNWDLNQGLLLALATNSSAYFTHTQLTKSQLNGLKRHLDRSGNSDPSQIAKALPDPKAMEDQVDRVLLRWPKGHFDSTIDLVSNPTKIPDSFTRGAHPYGWSGFAAAGPFKGLSTFSNNVHAQNSDPLSQAEVSRPLFGIDKEVYLGIILQNASSPKYRYHPGKGRNPSDFFASVDPTPGVTGINENILPPTFPRLTPVAPDGVFVSSPGYKAWEQINAVAAWQNTLVPPKAPIALDPKRVEQGKRVFQRAGCIRCHAGSAFTNNRIIPANVIGTEPSRAKALKKTGAIFGPPVIYSPDTPVPVPGKARTLRVPMDIWMPLS